MQWHHSQTHAGVCQHVGDLPASLGEPDAAAKVPTEIGFLCACLSRMLRVNHMTYIPVANTLFFACAESKLGQSRLLAGLVST